MNEVEDLGVEPVPTDWADQVLAYWFNPATKPLWFKGGAEFDAAVTERFAEWHATLRSGTPQMFLSDARTALAAVILFDQVPRNIHRGHADAFATDPLALAIARGVVTHGFDSDFGTDQRLFLYLPFEHSEVLDDQRKSLRLIGSLGDDNYLAYAQAHFDVIEQYGRFPHRNAALGRATREDEAAALAAGLGF
ncbi:MAG: DUF924 domain-containing protein [Sphingopyxis sp.]|nr:DUF924 domain-containing protein [Sphingopyxis sp.]